MTTWDQTTLGERMVLAAWTAVHEHLESLAEAEADELVDDDQNTPKTLNRLDPFDRELPW